MLAMSTRFDVAPIVSETGSCKDVLRNIRMLSED
jgi:hypothetical protein